MPLEIMPNLRVLPTLITPPGPWSWSDCRVTPRDNFVCGVQASGSGAQPGKWTIAAAALWRINWTSDTSLIEYKSQKCPCLSRLYQFARCLRLFPPLTFFDCTIVLKSLRVISPWSPTVRWNTFSSHLRFSPASSFLSLKTRGCYYFR